MDAKELVKSTGLNEEQIERYSRQIILKEVGLDGMKRLLNSKVVVVGGGGLGCPAIQILASTGIGNITLVDGDFVDISNLPRQVLHYSNDIGKNKAQSILEKVQKMNPEIKIEIIKEFLTKENAEEILRDSDFIIEASDNAPTKFLVNDVATYLGIPFSIASVIKFYGQIISVIPGKTACFRCLYGDIFETDAAQTCSGSGVMSTVPQIAGILQANEAIKHIIGLDLSFLNKIYAFDLIEGKFSQNQIKKDKNCPVCANPNLNFYKSETYNLNKICKIPNEKNI